MLSVAPTRRPSTSRAAWDALGHRHRLVAAGVVEHGGELLAAESAEQIGRAHRLARGFREDLQHTIAERVSEAVVDRFEMIEVDQQHRGRTRVAEVALGELVGVGQERAAVGDAGQGIEHGGVAVAQFGALLRHRQ